MSTSSALAEAQPVTLERSGSERHHVHTAQFYADDAFLCDAIAEYLSPALGQGMPIVLIATQDHVAAVLGRLEAQGLPVDEARRLNRLIILDAQAVLDRIMD